MEPPAWFYGELDAPTGSGIRVGVVDSGWDRSLDDPRVLRGVSFDRGGADPSTGADHDRHGHGTACTKILLRMCPNVELIPIRVFGVDLETSADRLGQAIRWAGRHGVHILNLSLGTTMSGAAHYLHRVCADAYQQGMIIVAAGKTGGVYSYPASFANVISVGPALYRNPFHYSYTAGELLECHAKATHPNVGGTPRLSRHVSSTSYAAPVISGIVALFLERHPGLGINGVRELLKKYATTPRAPTWAGGLH